MDDDDTASITINGTPHLILCGFCKAPVRKRAKSNREPTEYGCAKCGNWAEKDKVAKLVSEFAKVEMQLQLNRLARDTARKISFATFNGQTEHDRTHPFIVNVKI